MRSRLGVAALAALAVLPFASNAKASDDVELPRRWYGWQMLAAYGVADPMLAGALRELDHPSSSDLVLATSGLSIHVLAGPISHFTHGNVGRGFGSLGLELLTGGVGAGIGAVVGVVAGTTCELSLVTVSRCPPEYAVNVTAETALIGATIGVAVINFVDVAALAYDHPARKSPSVGFSVAPMLSPKLRGLAVAGSF